MPAYVPLPAALTEEVPEPQPPAPECVDGDGRPTLCNEQLAQWLESLRDWGRDAADRMRRVRERQP